MPKTHSIISREKKKKEKEEEENNNNNNKNILIINLFPSKSMYESGQINPAYKASVSLH